MKQSARLSPPNSIVFVMDPVAGELPSSIATSGVSVTGSCIAVGTLCEADGESQVVLTDDASEIPASHDMVFGGVLQTPHGVLCVCAVPGDPLLTTPVVQALSPVQVWTNDASEPDSIIVLVGRRAAS